MPDLDRALDDLDRTRAAFVGRVGALSDAERAFRPAPDAWTPTEIAEHVWRVEAGLVRGLEKQVRAGDDRRDLGPRQPGGLDRLAEAMRAGGRMRMPERAAPYIAPQGAPWADVQAGLAATAAEWRRVAATVPESLAETGVLMHAVTGPLTPAEGVRFAALHLEHHDRQLDRTLAAREDGAGEAQAG